jgi:hypothetical protein
MRDYSVRGIPTDALDRTRRELQASLALARPGSPVRVPIEANLTAIDTELAARASAPLRVCSCRFSTTDSAWFAGHLWESPGHAERDMTRYIT